MWLGLLLGCGPAVGDFVVAVEPAESVPSTLDVRWSTGEAGTSYVEYGTDGEFPFRTVASSEASTSHHFLVAGLAPDRAWNLRAVTEIEGERFASAETSVLPGALALQPPSLLSSGARDDAGYLVQPVVAPEGMIVLIDPFGDVAWTWPVGGEDTVARARLHPSGASIAYAEFPEARSGPGEIVHMRLDGVELSRTEVAGLHHDFAWLPDGAYAALVTDVREVDGEPVVGDAIIEVEADGTVRSEVWNAWDHWVPGELEDDLGYYPQGFDWLHCNTLEYEPDAATFLLSSRNRNSISRISRDTGAILWEIGGEESSLTLDSGSEFALQHSPLVVGSDLYVFDNARSGASAARRYALDFEAGTFREQWSRANPVGSNDPALGDLQPGETGNVLITWSTSGILEEVSESGESLWRADIELGHGFGFSEPAPQVGGPVDY